MTRRDKARESLRAEGWSLPLDIVPIDLLLDTKADALDIIAERDSLRAEVERLEIERGKAISVADYEARIRAEERAKIAAWLETRWKARNSRHHDSHTGGRQDECGELIDAITNNEHNAP